MYSCESASSKGAVDCNTIETMSPSSNPEIEAMRRAMVAFRSSLSPELLSEGSVCLEHERFYVWHNTPANKGNRDGITYGDLTEEQLIAFKKVMQLFLSADGYQKVYEITELSEGWLSEVKSDVWNPAFYSIDMFGSPDTTGSWGFQLDGHHCAVNFLVHGDDVSIVPAFLGGEPAADTYQGITFDIFADEKSLAVDLFNDMSMEELAMAVSNSTDRGLEVGPPKRNGYTDDFRGDYDYSGFATGLKYSNMSATTQANLQVLMKEYVYNLSTTFADKWWADVLANMEDTYFVWVYESGVTPSATAEFYYRIYNPYLWAEFNTEKVTGPNSKTIPAYNHIHCITRIPNNPTTDRGGDYGIFSMMINQNGPKTLYDHYAMADHHKTSKINFDYKIKASSRPSNTHSHNHGKGYHTH